MKLESNNGWNQITAQRKYVKTDEGMQLGVHNRSKNYNTTGTNSLK